MDISKIALRVARKSFSRIAKSDNPVIEDLEDKFGERDAKRLLDDLGIDDEDVDLFEDDDPMRLEAGREEWVGYESESDAERAAVEYVKDQLESEPELFNQSFLEGHIYMSKTDCRVYAGDDADSYIDGITDDPERVVEEAGNLDEYESLQEELEELESLDESTDEVESQIETLVSESEEKIREEIYERVYEALDDDPAAYFIDEQGIYSNISELIDNNLVSINTREAAEDAVRQDGMGHFLSGYDGDSVYSVSGTVWFRNN